MDVGIRIDGLRKVYTSPPPAAALARGGPMGGQRLFKRAEKKKVEIVALDGISLEVKAGEIFGLLGPERRGQVHHRRHPDDARAPDRGRRPGSAATRSGGERVAVKRLIGVVPQKPNLDFALTAREILTYHAAYFGIAAARPPRAGGRPARPLQADRPRRPDGARLLGRHDAAPVDRPRPDARARRCSSSTSRARASTRRRACCSGSSSATSTGSGHTVLLTTHNMEEADALCDRLAIVDHGRVIATGTPQALKRSVPGGFVVRLAFDRVPDGLTPALAADRRA